MVWHDMKPIYDQEFEFSNPWNSAYPQLIDIAEDSMEQKSLIMDDEAKRLLESHYYLPDEFRLKETNASWICDSPTLSGLNGKSYDLIA